MAKEFEPVRPKAGGDGGPYHISEIIPVVQAELTRSTEFALLDSPETKAMLRVARFGIALNLLGEIQTKDLKIPSVGADLLREVRAIDFGRSDEKTQIRLFAELVTEIDTPLHRMYRSVMAQWEPLAKETGLTNEELGKEKRERQDRFQRKDRRSRLEEVRNFRVETENIVLDRFTHYAEAWGEFLARIGRSDEDVKAQADRIMQRFQTAPREEQVKMAFDLRERSRNAKVHYFDELVLKYGSLIRRGIISPKQRGFISPEEWREKFGEIQDDDLQIGILGAFEHVISKANDKARESAELKRLVPAPVAVFTRNT